MFLFWFLCIGHHFYRLVKRLNRYFLIFSNSFSSSIRKDINLLPPFLTLNVLMYPIILGIIKTIALSKYPIKCLELVFILTNSEITTL